MKNYSLFAEELCDLIRETFSLSEVASKIYERDKDWMNISVKLNMEWSDKYDCLNKTREVLETENLKLLAEIDEVKAELESQKAANTQNYRDGYVNGDYGISLDSNYGLWVSRISTGEGMQLTPETLAAIFKEHF